MKIKQTLITICLILASVTGIGLIASKAVSADCAGVSTSIINCPGQSGQKGGDANSTIKNSGLFGILLIVINILTALIGVATVAGIIIAGIMYTTSVGNPAQTHKALMMLVDILIGVVLYVAMYALLNYLIPGGIFNQ